MGWGERDVGLGDYVGGDQKNRDTSKVMFHVFWPGRQEGCPVVRQKTTGTRSWFGGNSAHSDQGVRTRGSQCLADLPEPVAVSRPHLLT